MKKTALVIACLAASWPAAAVAQNYPTKPIKMIVPISVGSITDVAARLTAQELQERLGQSVIVINKPGAAMVLGGSECAKSDPDGYTLCVVSPDTMSFNPLTIPNLPYNPEKDFTPVIDMYHVVEGLMTPAASGINSIEELRAKAVAEPGKLNYGTLGERTTTDAFRQWLGEHWQTNFVAIPYKGGSEIIAALLGNTIDVTKIGVGNMTSQLKEGKIKVWRCAPRTARRSFPMSRPSRKRVLAHSPAGRSSGVRWFRPARRRRSSSACTTSCWRSSAAKSSPTSPTRTSSNRPPAQPRILPRSSRRTVRTPPCWSTSI
jgi:tripartite-type tricarboxylate transporter receptor subunit TctC